MGKPKDSGRINLRDIFLRAQSQLLANLSSADVFEHPTANGSAAETHWLNLFNRYLPQRYRATPAFIVDSRGHRSRQIDIAIYDHFYTPLLFPDDHGPHIPAESVYAVFEVKPTFSRQWLRDASEKAASVRGLQSHPIDLGCCLTQGSFSDDRINTQDILLFFIFQLLDRLRQIGTATAADWSKYCAF